MVMQHDCYEAARPKRATARAPYHFTECGLPGVWLSGIRYFECPSCSAQSAEIPAVSQLLALIARALVEKGSKLRGAEIRFLRKRLGKKAVEVSAALGITPETFSKYENDKLEVSDTVDGLVRTLYAFGSADRQLLKLFRQRLPEILANRARHRKPAAITASIRRNGWITESAA